MARVTRSSGRRAPSQSSTLDTPPTTANASPIFSARTSLKAESETPATSDKEDFEEEEEVEVKKKIKTTTARSSNKRKKSEQVSSDDEDDVKLEEVAATATRASKRRVSSNRAYVEITTTEVKRTQKVNLQRLCASVLKQPV